MDRRPPPPNISPPSPTIMRRSSREALDISSPRSSRAGSICSEGPSLTGPLSDLLASTLSPPPAYVAVSAASESVTTQHHEQVDDRDSDSFSEPDVDDMALFSDNALGLVNAFLDYLLYNFLFRAKGPSLRHIKPAILAVLKARLAREAMAIAEEELDDLGGGDDEEELADVTNGEQEWNLEVAFKRTRLRVMVYSRLGDMEDDEEERYLEQEDLFRLDGELYQDIGLVTGAAGIYLASVIEYVAKEVLKVAGQAAYSKSYAKRRRDARNSPKTQPQRVIVEESDVERVALNPTLSRLWRAWRKQLRASARSGSARTSFSRGASAAYAADPRRGSRGTMHSTTESHEGPEAHNESRRPSVAEVPECEPSETDIAANIPLPIGDNDVAEIEVPGLARVIGEEDDEEEDEFSTPMLRPQRPRSALYMNAYEAILPLTRLRSSSVPGREASSRWISADEKEKEMEELDATADDAEQPREEFETDEKPHVDEESEMSGTEIADEPQEGDNKRKSMAAGAIAGATALIGGAAAAILGSKHDNKAEDVKSRDRPRDLQIAGDYAEDADEPEKTPTPLTAVRVRKSGSHDDTPSHAVPEKPTVKVIDVSVPELKEVPVAQPAAPANASESETHLKQTSSTTTASPSKEEEVTPEPVTVEESAPEAAHVAESKNYSVNGYSVGVPKDSSPVRKVAQPATRNAHSPVLAETSKTEDQTTTRPHSGSLRKEPLEPVRESTEPVQRQNSRNAGPSTPPRRSSQGTTQFSTSTTTYSIGHPTIVNTNNQTPPSNVQEKPRRASKDSIYKSKTGGTQNIGADQRPRTSKESTNRASLTSRGSQSSTGAVMRPSRDGPPRDFDELVRGEETVKYTLTPQNMRNIEGSDSPEASEKTSIHPNDQDSQRSAPSIASRSSPPRAPAVAAATTSAQPVKIPGSVARSRLSLNRTPSTHSGNSKNGMMAREAKVQSESLRDFADWIRSTAPENPPDDPVPFNTSLGPQRRVSGGAPGSSHASQPPPPANRTKVNQRRLQPREPQAGGGESAALADFIRQGPDGGRKRVAEDIAPWEYPEPAGAAASQSVAPSLASTVKSTTGSVTSHTNLLPPQNRAQPEYASAHPGSRPMQTLAAPGQGEPVRRKRRVKDPYAIESDDEDDDTATLTRPKQRQEESLVDFLRNTEPPPGSNTPRPLVGVQPRGNPSAQGPTSGRPNGTMTNGATTAANRVNGTSASAAAAARRGSQASSGSARGKMTVRDPITARSSTRDLADFLRNSGPELASSAAPAPIMSTGKGVPQKKKSGRFWKRSKTAV